MYKDAPALRLQMYRQYSRTYGALTPQGEYQINERVTFGDGRAKGIVAWKYVDQGRGLIYILEDSSGFPFEMAAHEIIRAV
ncbi:hypothetical protein [Dictyobacter arantiisoli]|uniref:Uncharacterized protein n=1 Tax=Dictyobacter arantiisoli TaxID=2014874 RepID=A0A5A5TEZ9_9CHLR|nr:hypothetical protein [Dictyobacter arantiisoli]GCF09992.1 hypothetical protein KDI_35560 [Dictyobacter arantiisoli]